jgi:hypothetical protein
MGKKGGGVLEIRKLRGPCAWLGRVDCLAKVEVAGFEELKKPLFNLPAKAIATVDWSEDDFNLHSRSKYPSLLQECNIQQATQATSSSEGAKHNLHPTCAIESLMQSVSAAHTSSRSFSTDTQSHIHVSHRRC